MTEIYKLPQGKIIIGFCDENLSIGLLELKAGQELSKHSRPVAEELVQIHGACVVKLSEDDKLVRKVTLNEYEKLLIPAGQSHIHSNPTKGKSITLWKFEGDVVDVIENIRNGSKKIL